MTRQRWPRGTRTEQDDEQAQLADGAVGQDALEVVLAQRPPPAGQHGEQPDREHERAPRPGRRRSAPAER